MNAITLSAMPAALLLIIWACALLLIDLFVPRKWEGITAQLAAVGIIAALLVALVNAGDTSVTPDGMLVRDEFGTFLQAIFLLSGLIAVAQALDYIRRTGIERGEYYVLLLFTLAGMLLMAQSTNLVMVFIALEVLSIPLYVLSGFAKPRLASEESALKYFLLGAFASGFLAFGIALVYGATGSEGLERIVEVVRAGEATLPLLYAGAALILVGLGFKVAVVPFHMWTPDVYEGAPSSVTAFMSVGAKAAGFAALLRVFMAAFPDIGAQWGLLMALTAAVTMIWGNIAAVVQHNIKRMLAYSSIAHSGYLLMIMPAAAAGAISPALTAGLFYLLAYAVANLGAWSVVIALEGKQARGLSLEDYNGLFNSSPFLAAAMTLFLLSLTGIPPTIGFMGKFMIFKAVIGADYLWLAVIGVVTSLVSAFYYLRVVVNMFMRPGEPEVRRDNWLQATVWVAAVAVLMLGLFPGAVLSLAEKATMWLP